MRRMITRSRFLALTGAAALFTLAPIAAQAQSKKVYELRTYTANPGKLSELVRFFKEASDPAFQRHGMKSIGYWIPTDAPAHDDTFVYILEHPSREEATKNWAAFIKDEVWLAARKTFEANGALQPARPGTGLCGARCRNRMDQAVALAGQASASRVRPQLPSHCGRG